MKTINSVLGPISSENLGYTLMHEHILNADWSMRQAFSDWVVVDEFIDLAVKEIEMAKKIGIKTIVDCTPINLGRDMKIIHEVANRTGIQIIAATGYFHTEEQWLYKRSADTLAKYLLKDIEEGMEGTGIKPGILKCATDKLGITEINKNMLLATAKASKVSGLPIYTHSTYKNKAGEQQLELFLREGLDPQKIVIGHVGDTNDVDYIEKLIKMGCYVGLDRFGDDFAMDKNSLEDRVKTAVKLIEKGYVDQLIISHDHVVFVDIEENEWVKMRGIDVNNLPLDYCYINNKALPLFRKYGVSESDIHKMLYSNPSRYFGK